MNTMTFIDNFSFPRGRHRPLDHATNETPSDRHGHRFFPRARQRAQITQ
jgi:hypothetical protein